jgi:hypothetical protein
MTDFKIGDKIRVAFNEDVDKTGVIVDKGDFPITIGQEVSTTGEPKDKMQIFHWKVKLDATGEEKEYAADQLEKIE